MFALAGTHESAQSAKLVDSCFRLWHIPRLEHALPPDRMQLFRLRPFRNTDPPRLVDVWHSQGPSRGLTESVSVPTLEHYVLGKPYFDRHGLIVAEVNQRVVGFVHAGFGPNERYSDISLQDGIICMLQLLPEFDSAEARHQLCNAAEDYLAGKGAKRIFGGPHPPLTPFYHGLSAYSELPGVPAEDQAMHEMFRAHGYWGAREYAVMNCDLGSRRPIVDRNQRQLGRSLSVHATLDHAFASWWETCVFGPVPRSQFELVDQSGQRCGSMLWWDLELTRDRFGPAVAISRLEIADDRRRSGLATYLVSNALKQLKSTGTTLAQVLVATSNDAASNLFTKLGFREFSRGTAYLKHLEQ